MKRSIIFSLILCTLLIPAAMVRASNEKPTKEEVVAFVEEGREFAKQNGKEAFFKEITEGTKFKRGLLYFYVYDFQGVVLAHGAKPALVGKSLIDMKDKDGLPVIQTLRDTAAKGSGWVEYNWQNPDSKKVEKKLGYVVKFDDSWWFGSGTYTE